MIKGDKALRNLSFGVFRVRFCHFTNCSVSDATAWGGKDYGNASL